MCLQLAVRNPVTMELEVDPMQRVAK
jgi:hypothetical protein